MRRTLLTCARDRSADYDNAHYLARNFLINSGGLRSTFSALSLCPGTFLSGKQKTQTGARFLAGRDALWGGPGPRHGQVARRLVKAVSALADWANRGPAPHPLARGGTRASGRMRRANRAERPVPAESRPGLRRHRARVPGALHPSRPAGTRFPGSFSSLLFSFSIEKFKAFPEIHPQHPSNKALALF